MKSRNGFVSNSSSSSFVLVIKKTDEKEMLDSLNLAQREVMAYLEDGEQEFCGHDCIIYAGEVGYIYENLDITAQIDEMIIGYTDKEKEDVIDFNYGSAGMKRFHKDYNHEPCPRAAFDAIKTFPENSIESYS